MDNTERRKMIRRTPLEARIRMYIFRAAAVACSDVK
jgi:hypothetical protein